MLILGINAYHGDASAAAIVDGRLVAAAEEERFNRIKHAAGFPSAALEYADSAADVSRSTRRILAIPRDPWARLLSKARYALRMPSFAARRVGVQGRFATIGREAERALNLDAGSIEVIRVEHHLAHMASSFFVSPFDEAALFSIDGMGDFASAAWGVGRSNRITPLGSVEFPHSLGIFYTALTQYLGFPKYGDEYKVMGLASYGEPEFADEMRKIVIAPNHGAMDFRLNTDYFVHSHSGAAMTWNEGEPTLGTLFSGHLADRLGPARHPDADIQPRHFNVASSLQFRLEEIVLDRLRSLQKATGLRKLCIAGGVAFNCVNNGKILDHTGFDDIYIQSAAGDAGLAIGSAMYVWHQSLGNERGFTMNHSYWGPEFADNDIDLMLQDRRSELDLLQCRVIKFTNENELYGFVAARIAAGEVIGWFQGRMEWGPRALGNRSILADPRRPEMRDILNAKIKRRELFRPFAPSIAEEAVGEYFESSYPSPFMLMAYAVKPQKRGVIPATTHVDGTGRLQTVNERQNPRYYGLIKQFERLTGVPVLLNTSFNENEPVVCRPEEALHCFLRTRMDVLAMGNYVVVRDEERRAPDWEKVGGLVSNA